MRSDFYKEFGASRRRFKIMQGFVVALIIIVFVMIMSFWSLVGYTAVEAKSQIKEKGLKTLVERVWCGPIDKCLEE